MNIIESLKNEPTCSDESIKKLSDKHWSECSQIALYDDQLTKALILLRKISEVHYAALHSGCKEVSAMSGNLMHRIRDLELEIKGSCIAPANVIEPDIELVKPGKDNINHPAHYETKGIECIQAMEITQGTDAVMAFCLCNAFKYLWRHDRKGSAEDIKKAIWYLNKYVELEGKQE